jgi:hypothetical protein
LRPRLSRHRVAKTSEGRVDAAEQALAIIGHSRDARAVESEESPHVADRRRSGCRLRPLQTPNLRPQLSERPASLSIKFADVDLDRSGAYRLARTTATPTMP